MAERKLAEKNYQYWENEFDGHKSYMISGDGNEYDILRKLIFHFVGDAETFLDIGCASGDNLEAGERSGKLFSVDYKGTDYAAGFIKANTARRPEVSWEVMDARELKEGDNSWDNVCIYDVLDALDGWEDALSEAFRVAKKRVIVLMWMDAHMDEKRDYMRSLGLRVIEIDIQGDGIHYHKMLIGEK